MIKYITFSIAVCWECACLPKSPVLFWFISKNEAIGSSSLEKKALLIAGDEVLSGSEIFFSSEIVNDRANSRSSNMGSTNEHCRWTRDVQLLDEISRLSERIWNASPHKVAKATFSYPENALIRIVLITPVAQTGGHKDWVARGLICPSQSMIEVYVEWIGST